MLGLQHIVGLCVLCSLLVASTAESGCDIALGGRTLDTILRDQLSAEAIAAGKLSVSSSTATGYCGSLGVADVTETTAGKLPKAVVLTSGSYDTAVSSAPSQTVASYSTGFDLEDPVVDSYAEGKTTRDVVMLELVVQSTNVPQVLTMDYVWATDELNTAYDDLAVITIAQCLNPLCTVTSGWTLLSAVGTQGKTVSLRTMRAAGSLLIRNYKGEEQNVPFNSISEKLTTQPFTLLKDTSYKLKVFVADIGDTSMDTVLYLGAFQLSDATQPPSAGQAPPSPVPVVVNKDSKDKGIPVGPVVGGVVGGVLGLFALLLVIVALMMWRKGKKQGLSPNPSLNSIHFQSQPGTPVSSSRPTHPSGLPIKRSPGPRDGSEEPHLKPWAAPQLAPLPIAISVAAAPAQVNHT